MYNMGQIVTDEAEIGTWFESLICDISTRFTNLPISQLDVSVCSSVRIFVREAGIDWSTLWQKSPERPGALILTHVYQQGDTGEAVEADPDPFARNGGRIRHGGGALALAYGEMETKAHFPWIFEQLERGETVVVESVEELPPSARREKQVLLRYGMKSIAVVPLWMGREWLGCLSFATKGSERKWPGELVKRLELMGHLFTNAMARKAADNAMRENAARLQTFFDASVEGIITIDPQGLIESVNAARASFRL